MRICSFCVSSLVFAHAVCADHAFALPLDHAGSRAFARCVDRGWISGSRSFGCVSFMDALAFCAFSRLRTHTTLRTPGLRTSLHWIVLHTHLIHAHRSFIYVYRLSRVSFVCVYTLLFSHVADRSHAFAFFLRIASYWILWFGSAHMLDHLATSSFCCYAPHARSAPHVPLWFWISHLDLRWITGWICTHARFLCVHAFADHSFSAFFSFCHLTADHFLRALCTRTHPLHARTSAHTRCTSRAHTHRTGSLPGFTHLHIHPRVHTWITRSRLPAHSVAHTRTRALDRAFLCLPHTHCVCLVALPHSFSFVWITQFAILDGSFLCSVRTHRCVFTRLDLTMHSRMHTHAFCTWFSDHIFSVLVHAVTHAHTLHVCLCVYAYAHSHHTPFLDPRGSGSLFCLYSPRGSFCVWIHCLHVRFVFVARSAFSRTLWFVCVRLRLPRTVCVLAFLTHSLVYVHTRSHCWVHVYLDFTHHFTLVVFVCVWISRAFFCTCWSFTDGHVHVLRYTVHVFSRMVSAGSRHFRFVLFLHVFVLLSRSSLDAFSHCTGSCLVLTFWFAHMVAVSRLRLRSYGSRIASPRTTLFVCGSVHSFAYHVHFAFTVLAPGCVCLDHGSRSLSGFCGLPLDHAVQFGLPLWIVCFCTFAAFTYVCTRTFCTRTFTVHSRTHTFWIHLDHLWICGLRLLLRCLGSFSFCGSRLPAHLRVFVWSFCSRTVCWITDHWITFCVPRSLVYVRLHLHSSLDLWFTFILVLRSGWIGHLCTGSLSFLFCTCVHRSLVTHWITSGSFCALSPRSHFRSVNAHISFWIAFLPRFHVFRFVRISHAFV